MSMLRRLEVTDSLVSRGALIKVPAHDTSPRDASRRRPLLQALVTMWRLWRERLAARRVLATLDTRTLRDIGIAPELVDFELSRSSWRPLLDWRAARYGYGIDGFVAGPARDNRARRL